MAEEAKAEEAVVEKEEATPEPNEIEQIAMELGWNPDFKGDGAKTAKEFILNSRAIQDTQKHQNDRLRKQIESKDAEHRANAQKIYEHLKAVRDAEVGRLQAEITDLKAQREQAIDDGDSKTVKRLDGKIDKMERSIPPEPPKPVASAPNWDPAEVTEWMTEREWTKDPELGKFLDEYVSEFVETRDGKIVRVKGDIHRILNAAERKAKELYPEHFETKAKPKAPQVEGAKARPAGSKKTTFDDLPSDAKKMFREFKDMGVEISQDEYIKDWLAKAGQ